MRHIILVTLIVLFGCDNAVDTEIGPRPESPTEEICPGIIPLCLNTTWIYVGWSDCDPAVRIDTVRVSQIDVINGDSLWTLTHSTGLQEMYARSEDTVMIATVDSATGVVNRSALFWLPTDSVEIHGQTTIRFLQDTIQTLLGPVGDRIQMASKSYYQQDSPYSGTYTEQELTVRPGVGIISKTYRWGLFFSCDNCGQASSCSSRELLISFRPG